MVIGSKRRLSSDLHPISGIFKLKHICTVLSLFVFLQGNLAFPLFNKNAYLNWHLYHENIDM